MELYRRINDKECKVRSNIKSQLVIVGISLRPRVVIHKSRCKRYFNTVSIGIDPVEAWHHCVQQLISTTDLKES